MNLASSEMVRSEWTFVRVRTELLLLSHGYVKGCASRLESWSGDILAIDQPPFGSRYGGFSPERLLMAIKSVLYTRPSVLRLTRGSGTDVAPSTIC